MSWISAAYTIEFWGCINADYAYHACVLDTYYDAIEHPDEIRIRLRAWDALFKWGPSIYMKFQHDGYLMRICQKD